MRRTEYFKEIANTVKLNSNDITTQTGCVIVDGSDMIVATGCNRFPFGVKTDISERQERPEKYYWFIHAEISAIVESARSGLSTDGCTMYMSCGLPCCDCAKAIINAGIKRIYCVKGEGVKGPVWDGHFERSVVMLEEAGIEVIYY